ncbi:uncharacterized protein BT62DRAFT_1081687 [Guyanagaster necrorhizus]|uniref:Carbohydrate-binding module family 50 protein n=1 Tax=Guyanagaster necrorhizus TaxID=856835 RepID=A0A9P7VE63_9AGAR|nr:uncharacterized protein BT62DRAFT_1081687 [Guyanagaster necrorhizus MCA 3950]KAG7439261.1 hypothetical protein BT62DRAFT_1081687 [Guyanagaster necrorhizus MCA 3950]
MTRWSQYHEDSCRLPEGFRRIGYDADTSRYTFSDKRGRLYHGAPGAEYGTLTPVNSASTSRPEAFYSDRRKPKVSVSPPAKTFHDFLPSSAITSPSNPLPPSPTARFVNAARQTALPKMQGVVQSLRRSTIKSGRYDEEKRGLLRIPSTSTTASASSVGRSKSSATPRSSSQYKYNKTHSRKASA